MLRACPSPGCLWVPGVLGLGPDGLCARVSLAPGYCAPESARVPGVPESRVSLGPGRTDLRVKPGRPWDILFQRLALRVGKCARRRGTSGPAMRVITLSLGSSPTQHTRGPTDTAGHMRSMRLPRPGGSIL